MGYSKQITCFSTENAKKCSSKVISNSFNQGNSEIVFRVFNNSELKGAHFKILPEKVPIFAKNVRFLYYR